MHRKALQLLMSSALRRVSVLSSVNRVPPCSRLHLTRHLLSSEEPAPRITQEEQVTDFSKYDPDQFGTLVPQKKHINEVLEEMPEEEDDKIEFLLEEETGRKVRRNIAYYTRLIKKFVDERKIADALDVMEERMLKRDKVQPTYYIYNILINGCASVGYTLKAFKLYHQMKKAGVKRTGATYTGLFNACANTPFPEDGIMRVNTLRKELVEKSVPLNAINYHTLIKAYARLHDVKAAFLVVDEMMDKQYTVTEDTFVFLLQACASDKEAGFRHALILWHKMRAKRVVPNIFVYNQLLRCVRDCGIGNAHEAIDAVKKIADQRNTWHRRNDIQIEANTDKNDYSVDIPSTEENGLSADLNDTNLPEISESDDISLLEKKENRPNLLHPVPHLGSIVQLKDVNTSSDRLLLLGGFRNVLEEMKLDKVKPEIKTFTMLLDMIPSTLTAEEAFIREMRKLQVPIDIDFCNMLIKKRAFRLDYQNGRATLELIQSLFLNPDIVTFGVLALCCRTQQEAYQLIGDMKQFGYRLNVEVLGAMLRIACSQYNYDYVIFLLKFTKKLGIQPSEKFMDTLRTFAHLSSNHFNIRENRKKNKSYTVNPKSFEKYKMFRDYYRQWKREINVFVPPHPYQQFKERTEPTDEDVETIDAHAEPETKDAHDEPKFKTKSKPEEIVYRGSPAKWKVSKMKPKLLDADFRRSDERRPRKFRPKENFEDEHDAKPLNWKRSDVRPKQNFENEHDAKPINWKRSDVKNSVSDSN